MDQARALLDGLPGGGLNIAYEAVDRHVAHGLGDKIALRWIGQDDAIRDLTYSDLQRQTNKFANALRSLDIAKGDRVYCLLGRVPELYIAALGALKAGAVFCPLFRRSDRAHQSPHEHRRGEAARHDRAFLPPQNCPWRNELGSLRHVILIDGDATGPRASMALQC